MFFIPASEACDINVGLPSGKRHIDGHTIAYASELERPLYSGRRHFDRCNLESTQDGDSSPRDARRYQEALCFDLKRRYGGGSSPRKQPDELEFLKGNANTWRPPARGSHIPDPPPLKKKEAPEDPAVDKDQKTAELYERLQRPLRRDNPKKAKKHQEEKHAVDVESFVKRMDDYLRIHNTNKELAVASSEKKENALRKTLPKIVPEELDSHLRRLIDDPLHKKEANRKVRERKEEKERPQTARLSLEQVKASASRLHDASVDHQRQTMVTLANKYCPRRPGTTPRRSVSARSSAGDL